ncbi:MAG: hypothetical protein QOI22_1522, partial [Verrucomicrobiota bacterium]
MRLALTALALLWATVFGASLHAKENALAECYLMNWQVLTRFAPSAA